MKWSTGHTIFTLFFLFSFLLLMAWAYRKDLKFIGKQFPKPYWVILMLLGFIMLLYAIVKFRNGF